MKRKPNLFIVGHPKSGTTALHSFLNQHPDVYMSALKEPSYFCKDFHRESDAFFRHRLFFEIREEQQYLELFSKAGNKKIIGESSALVYLYSQVAAEEIFRFNPDAKIIIMLRNPADFLHSLHNQFIILGYEDVEDFKTALSSEQERRTEKHIPSGVRTPSFLYYSQWIKYAEQVKRYYEFFDPCQIKVIIFEDFKANNGRIYSEVSRFLDIDSDFIPEFTEVNPTKRPRYKKLHSILFNPLLKKMVKTVCPPICYDRILDGAFKVFMKEEARASMDGSTRYELMEKCRNDMSDLDILLGTHLDKKWGGGVRK